MGPSLFLVLWSGFTDLPNVKGVCMGLEGERGGGLGGREGSQTLIPQ